MTSGPWAAQARLLLRLGRPLDAAERALAFVGAARALLVRAVACGTLPAALPDAWTFSAAVALTGAIHASVVRHGGGGGGHGGGEAGVRQPPRTEPAVGDPHSLPALTVDAAEAGHGPLSGGAAGLANGQVQARDGPLDVGKGSGGGGGDSGGGGGPLLPLLHEWEFGLPLGGRVVDMSDEVAALDGGGGRGGGGVLLPGGSAQVRGRGRWAVCARLRRGGPLAEQGWQCAADRGGA
eukprot:17226-Chlamydomonas_euryale.AAC.2